jgi:hypothetical protein
MKNRLVILPILIATLCGCGSADRGSISSHLARCEIEWRAMSDRTQNNYGNDQGNFARDCMDAADFQPDTSTQMCLGQSATFISACYEDRRSAIYQVTKFFHRNLK